MLMTAMCSKLEIFPENVWSYKLGRPEQSPGRRIYIIPMSRARQQASLKICFFLYTGPAAFF